MKHITSTHKAGQTELFFFFAQKQIKWQLFSETDKSRGRRGSILQCNFRPFLGEGNNTHCRKGCSFLIANTEIHSYEAQSNQRST